MLAFLQNPWVVGIGGGIISGIIVFFITNWIYRRKDNSKYIEQINSANTDIIRALKPYVAERGLPEKEVIDAIVVSTARKYKVKSDELYSVRIICEELIREVVENIYVSSEKKYEYTKQLSEYLRAIDETEHRSYLVTDIEKEMRNLNAVQELDYRRFMATSLSALLAIFVALFTMLLSVASLEETNIAASKFEVAIVLVVAVMTLASIGYYCILRYFKRKKRKRKSDSASSYEDRDY